MGDSEVQTVSRDGEVNWEYVLVDVGRQKIRIPKRLPPSLGDGLGWGGKFMLRLLRAAPKPVWPERLEEGPYR